MARHLLATGELLDDDPVTALGHARAARQLAPRIAPVREALGLAAYRNGEWQSAIAELRTYHRLTGRQTHLAVIADAERAQGRPERAIDIYRTADRSKLAPDEAAELLIVAAGARGDMGQRDAAVAMLQVRELTAASREPWVARLRYAYAEALLAAGRRDEAREWFGRAADIDDELNTAAAERMLELDGVVLDDVDVAFEEDEDEDELRDTAADEDDIDDEAVLDDEDDIEADDDIEAEVRELLGEEDVDEETIEDEDLDEDEDRDDRSRDRGEKDNDLDVTARERDRGGNADDPGTPKHGGREDDSR
ncbi:Replicase polyprotein 1ab [Planosporangium sp. 12N6]|uniref:Replicase polyprotein 1ab n=1 Tax=Planosporangium spinosum TaxID=3402278 RepID=UPI003CF568C8